MPEPFRVVRLGADDAAVYRSVRLEALTADPAVFASTFEREQSFEQSTWMERLTSPNVGIWALFETARAIGMTGAYVAPEDPERCQLWGSWITPDFRGRGISALLFPPRIAWARRRGLRSVVGAHRASNEASCGALRSQGFQFSHTEAFVWPDGKTEDIWYHELPL